MTDHFNRLTPAQAERLAMLIEEAGEIVQAGMKILRHGYASCHPDNRNMDRDNRADLEKELGDLMGVMEHMIACGDLINADVDRAARYKLIRARPYMHHYEAPKP